MRPQQHERAYQKQRNIFENKKRVLGAKVKGSELRFVKSIGLGFKTPTEVCRHAVFTGAE